MTHSPLVESCDTLELMAGLPEKPEPHAEPPGALCFRVDWHVTLHAMPLYTVDEFHKLTGIPLRTLYYRIKKGIFAYPGAKIIEEKVSRFRVQLDNGIDSYHRRSETRKDA